MSYSVAANGYLNAIRSYAGLTLLGSPTLYLAGATLAPPTGSNLPATAAVGRYGSFVGATGANNFGATATPNESKQLPMLIGKTFAWVSFVGVTRTGHVGASNPLPAYGN
jgi:hypothetical protein